MRITQWINNQSLGCGLGCTSVLTKDPKKKKNPKTARNEAAEAIASTILGLSVSHSRFCLA